MVDLTDITLTEEINASEGVTVVDFWADWCPPCKAMHPILEQLEKDYPKVRWCRLDADKFPTVCQKYDVRSLPTLLVFKNAEVQHRIIGAQSKDNLLDELGEFL